MPLIDIIEVSTKLKANSMLNVLKRKYLLYIIAFAASCGTPGSLKPPANLSLSIADSNFNEVSPIGNKSLKMDTNQHAMWLTFSQPGSPTGYALVITPKYFRGEDQEFKITPKEGVQSKDTSTTTIGSSFYNEYFDLVLRGHRAIMGGDLEKANETIERLKEKYSETYGSHTLDLLLSISKNQTKDILESVDSIKRIYPESVLVKSLEGTSAQ